MTKITPKHYLNLKSWIFVAAILTAAFFISLFAIRLTQNFTNTTAVFALAVLFVARFTSGYIYGIATAIIGTFLVNFAFTFPILKIDLSLYPACFLLLLFIAVSISMLMSQYKHKSEIEYKLEREKMTVDLLRSISHDLRSPLTSIAGSASVYLEESEKLSEDVKTELITDVRDEAQRLIRIVENILTITRVDDANFNIQKSPEAVEEIIGAAVLGFKKNNQSIKIVTSIPDELLLVPMDVMLIYQVLKNIMENSVIHGGNVTQINITVKKQDSNAVFIVSDNGCGINEDMLPKLFEGVIVSSDGNQSAQGRSKSIGIGLSLCRSIIRLHGGKLSATNGKNCGAEFVFTLPLE